MICGHVHRTEAAFDEIHPAVPGLHPNVSNHQLLPQADESIYMPFGRGVIRRGIVVRCVRSMRTFGRLSAPVARRVRAPTLVASSARSRADERGAEQSGSYGYGSVSDSPSSESLRFNVLQQSPLNVPDPSKVRTVTSAASTNSRRTSTSSSAGQRSSHPKWLSFVSDTCSVHVLSAQSRSKASGGMASGGNSTTRGKGQLMPLQSSPHAVTSVVPKNATDPTSIPRDRRRGVGFALDLTAQECSEEGIATESSRPGLAPIDRHAPALFFAPAAARHKP